jgi:hypothetical protein
MKHFRSRVLSLFVLGLIAFQAAAFADTIEGRVAAAAPGSFEVTVYDPQGRPYPNNLRLDVDQRTRLAGFSSFDQLNDGDPVSVDVTQQETGTWHADKIALFQNIEARPATKNPPPTMRDVLGNPVVKGALLGAATGAIASGTSGGKAGKGALVGAGVGALGGILFGGGNKRSDRNDDQN